MKRLALGLAAVLLLSGSTAALTFSIEPDFDFSSDEYSVAEGWICTQLTAYLMPGCQLPIETEFGGTTTDTVQYNVYNNGVLLENRQQQSIKGFDSKLNASYGVAMAKAKAQAIQDLNAGHSKTEAVENITDIVNDYYGQIQKNTYATELNHIYEVNKSVSLVKDTDGLTVIDVFKAYGAVPKSSGGFSFDWAGDFEREFGGTQPADLRLREFNVSTIDNDTVEMPHIQVKIRTEDNGYNWYNFTTEKSYQNNLGNTVYRAYNADGNYTEIYNAVKYVELRERVQSKRDAAYDNSYDIVDNIYAQYSANEINISQSLGPLEILKTASTSYNSTGYYDYATLTAQQMGLNTNDTFAFEVEWTQEGSSTTKNDTGQLFVSEGTYNNSIEVGTEYDASGKQVWLVRNDENGELVNTELNGTFTVTSMTNKKTGEEVNSTSIQTVNPYDSDIEGLKAEIEALSKQVEDYSAAGGGGGLIPEGSWLDNLLTAPFEGINNWIAENGALAGGVGVGVIILLLLGA